MAVAFLDLINQQEIARQINEFFQLPSNTIIGQQKNIISNNEKRKYTKKQTTNKPFMCDPCGKRFEQKGNLFTHIYKMHTTPSWKKLKCDICSLEYKRPSCYEKHIKTHNLNCSECNQKFSTPLGLAVHLRFKHKIYQRYKCSNCTEEFQSKENLRLHSQVCGNNIIQYNSTLQTNNKLLLRKNGTGESNLPSGNNSVITLPIATTNDQIVTRKSSFDLSKKSNEIRSAICDICLDNFDLDNDWLAHMIGHYNYSIKMCHCKICDHTVESLSNMTNHFFDKHLFDKNYRCHSCSASFGSMTDLWSHMARMHSNLNDNSTRYLPVQCNYCERLFGGQTELRIHQIKTLHCINENANGFQCKLCNEKFVTIYRLLKHLSEHPAS